MHSAWFYLILSHTMGILKFHGYMSYMAIFHQIPHGLIWFSSRWVPRGLLGQAPPWPEHRAARSHAAMEACEACEASAGEPWANDDAEISHF